MWIWMSGNIWVYLGYIFFYLGRLERLGYPRVSLEISMIVSLFLGDFSCWP